MADIFGRERNDYRHLRDLEQRSSQATVTEYLTASAQAVGRSAHSFNALGGVTHRAFEGEAQVLGFLTNNLQAIQSVIDEVLYTEHRLPEFIPIISDVPEGATTYEKCPEDAPSPDLYDAAILAFAVDSRYGLRLR